MKKILALTLVLSIASLASATYTIGLVGSTITVSSDVGLIGGLDLGIAVIGNATIDNFAYRTVDAPVNPPVVVGYSAADLLGSGAPYESYTGGWTTFQFGDPVTTPNGAGMWFTATVTGTVGTQLLLTDSITGEAFGGVGQSVTIVPEPITMALLGLGGLFIRKRK
ncbi:MAG: PEP-CTERM sorting domain-containing protein [Phycisphaerales bacterium]